MTIIDIAREIELKEKKTVEQKSTDKTDWKPTECTDYILPQLNIPVIRSKVCVQRTLGKVLAFIDMVKYKRLAHGCTIMPIASTNKKLVSICGSQRNVSNMIKFMISIGLLDEENKDYQFNATQEEYNKAKTYRYYYDNEQRIQEYCKENNINKYVIKNNNKSHIHTVVEKFKIENFENEQVRFSSQLHLLKPDNYSVTQFENYITNILYQNYPYLSYYQELADSINEKYYADYPEMAIDFTPHFTWNKGNKAITKIGIRATNSLVSAKKDKDNNSNFNGFYKEDILNKYELNLEKDVTSSVPRITLSINKQQWITEDIDIYEIIYNQYKNIRNYYINTVVEKFEEVRPAIKKLHMRGYFDKPNMLGVHTRRAMANVENKKEIDEEMRIYQQAIIEAEGGYLFGSEIFYHESCIYMDVLKELLDKGFKVWMCYDAWYASKKEIEQEDFKKQVTEIVKEKANYYINTVVEKLNESKYKVSSLVNDLDFNPHDPEFEDMF